MESQNPNPNPSETDSSDTDSVPPVEPKYDLILPSADPDSSLVKCTSCKQVAEQLWWKLIPQGLEEQMDPMEQLEKAKRLMFCMACAYIRVTN